MATVERDGQSAGGPAETFRISRDAYQRDLAAAREEAKLEGASGETFKTGEAMEILADVAEPLIDKAGREYEEVVPRNRSGAVSIEHKVIGDDLKRAGLRLLLHGRDKVVAVRYGNEQEQELAKVRGKGAVAAIIDVLTSGVNYSLTPKPGEAERMLHTTVVSREGSGLAHETEIFVVRSTPHLGPSTATIIVARPGNLRSQAIRPS
jgi:hypothetical protein